MHPNSTPVDRSCVQCGQPFRAPKPSSKQRFCCLACAQHHPSVWPKERHVLEKGQVFGRLTIVNPHIVGRSGENRHLFVTVFCSCSPERIYQVSKSSVVKGNSRSCGCLGAEMKVKRLTTHGGSSSRLYHTWCSMRDRCRRPRNRDFHSYGGRGISVCQEWESSFEAFRDWALSHGYADDLSIDRIDPNGNYEPANCRFIPLPDQGRNQRHTGRVTAFGETKSISEWARDPRCAVNGGSLGVRLKSGMAPEQAITAPARFGSR